MTQIAFLNEISIPQKVEIENHIQELGYDFKFLENFSNLLNHDGLSCSINGHKTFFEIYIDQTDEIISEEEWIKSDITNQDVAISFVWGADLAAGACIGLISIGLIDKCEALVYYLDDEMKYTREMLLADTSQFLNELQKK
ncbi:MAG: hypothetical protein AAFP89_03965 [Bacteroidota bacterium]